MYRTAPAHWKTAKLLDVLKTSSEVQFLEVLRQTQCMPLSNLNTTNEMALKPFLSFGTTYVAVHKTVSFMTNPPKNHALPFGYMNNAINIHSISNLNFAIR